MSLDGFIADPNPTIEEPLGQGGESLHEWAFKLAEWRQAHSLSGGEVNQNSQIIEETLARTGAVIMGRKMFSGGDGPWENDPMAGGWWTENPPFHCPVFILTNHERETVQKAGGTTYTFVTEGIESALAQAKAAAGDKDIQIGGGANTIQQFINSGNLDEIQINLVPILLGSGRRLLENVGSIKLEKIRTIETPEVTHLKFKIRK